jgi:hypothetical protein
VDDIENAILQLAHEAKSHSERTDSTEADDLLTRAADLIEVAGAQHHGRR